MASLFVKEGTAAGMEFRLAGPRVSIGRAADNDVQLDDRTVSRYHAVMTERRDGWHINDLGSHNRIVVNGAPVLAGKLVHNDEIQLGSVVLAFCVEGAAPAERPAPERPGASAEITQTIRLSDLQGSGPAGPLGQTLQDDHRLRLLLTLTELAVSVRSLQALFDSVVQVLRRTLSVDRVIPVLEEGQALRPFLESRHDFGDSLEALGVSLSVVNRCRREGLAGVWRNAGPSPNVACVPIRVGSKDLGLIYCDRADPTAEFTNRDLTYLLAVAIQTGAAIENVRSMDRLSRRARSLSRQLAQRYDMVGRSEPMQALYEFIRKAAPTDAGILVCGESGTGKEMVARAIHQHSRRSEGPLEIVSCAAIPTGLLESELFGHVRGAFTGAVADRPGRFELADGGTLFLDEVVEMPLECQTKLLRALEEGNVRRVGDTRDRAVDVRLIAATNRDPAEALAQGRLRQDLFYRLDRLRCVLPPLRDRLGDVELLAGHFLEQINSSTGHSVEGFAPGVLELFKAYDWPGNVRELKNVVERMVLLADGPVLGLDHVPEELRAAPGAGAGDAVAPLDEMERKHILSALQAAGGNKKRAAEMLGIDRSTLYAKLKRYGLGA